MQTIDYDKWEGVIGLEVHAQLNTKTKAFCADPYIFGSNPNTQVSPVSLAHPGTLPKPNRRALEFAIKMGLACGSKIHLKTWYARKNYFYADLPKGYQITQFVTPICTEGGIKIKFNNQEKFVTLDKIILEEDSGKSLHDLDPFSSLIDLNRAGVPLIEIVTNPDMHLPEEAYSYLTEIRKLVQYLDICDGNMEDGSMRCDANVSVRLKGTNILNQRVEIKNLNSIRNVQRAITYEIKRQIELYENGGKVDMESLGFDAGTGATFPMRSKELANDYRYFAEPDIPPYVLKESDIEEVRKTMPELPEHLYNRLISEMNLSPYDAGVITAEKSTVDYFLEVVAQGTNQKAAINWINGPIRGYLNDKAFEFSAFNLAAKQLSKLIEIIEKGTVNFSIASQKIFPELIKNPEKDISQIIEELNLSQNNNEEELLGYIKEVLLTNSGKVLEYKSGKKGLLGMFMGQVMKLSGGKADPKITASLLEKELEA